MDVFRFQHATVPEQCRVQQIAALLVGEKAYIESEALRYDEEWLGWIDITADLAYDYTSPDAARVIPIYRLPEGFVVDLLEYGESQEIGLEEVRANNYANSSQPDADSYYAEPTTRQEILVIGFIATKEEREAFLDHYKEVLHPPGTTTSPQPTVRNNSKAKKRRAKSGPGGSPEPLNSSG